MATLAAGDVTTQLTTWLNANAAGSDKHPKAKAALATALTVSASSDMTTMLALFINR